jgi:hypothetical protein
MPGQRKQTSENVYGYSRPIKASPSFRECFEPGLSARLVVKANWRSADDRAIRFTLLTDLRVCEAMKWSVSGSTISS